MRHKEKAILYWFGSLESKTLHPVLRFVLLRIAAGLHGRSFDGLLYGLHVTRDALARLILGDRQGQWSGVQIGYNRET
jgi:hypothetical protein